MKTLQVFGIVAALAVVGCHDSPTEPLSPTPTPLPTFAVPTATPSPTYTPTQGGPPSFAVQGGCSGGQPTWIVTNLGATMLSAGQWAIASSGGVVAEVGGFQLQAGGQQVITPYAHILSSGQWTLVLIYQTFASSTTQECTGVPFTPTFTATQTPTPQQTPTPAGCGFGGCPTPTPCPPGPGGSCQ